LKEELTISLDDDLVVEDYVDALYMVSFTLTKKGT
jgi:hypothetical protein